MPRLQVKPKPKPKSRPAQSAKPAPEMSARPATKSRKEMKKKKKKKKAKTNAGKTKLLDLPIELLDMIASRVKKKYDLLSLALTCRGSWAKWGSQDDWPVERLGEQEVQLKKKKTVRLYYFPHAKKGQVGYLPFYVDRAERDGDEVVISVLELEPDHLSRSKGRIVLDRDRLDDIWDDEGSVVIPGPLPVERAFDWHQRRHQLATAPQDWLALKSPCPVCHGKESASAGSKLILQRWPAMEEYEGNPERQIDCPGCLHDYTTEDEDDTGEGLLAFLEDYDIQELEDYER